MNAKTLKCASNFINALSTCCDELTTKERIVIFNLLSGLSQKLVGIRHPVLNVRLVEANLVFNNDFSAESITLSEDCALKKSIRKEGLTMPIVVGQCSGESGYTVTDGAHRMEIIKSEPDIRESLANHIPVVIINNMKDSTAHSIKDHAVG
ncbi:ParB N-terminal domain-containing protein [Vibrio barjaei]|uniref:ParB N-terminal domain-containing protein n=1 Tax=Vibrio barjaei TaxID=1676683 RepID=UPI00228391DA|nr:ParB N-terminal domain-containing protein [Vibrio barjaei]MCY9871792.1 ParB N-terminal domain-containing protein [Vibrio barjaei]